MLYLIFGFIFLSCGLFLYRFMVKKITKTDLWIIGLTGLNSILLFSNPGNLVTDFLG